jgi:hypothetical protein
MFTKGDIDGEGVMRDGWFGRIGREFSFGPTTEVRAKAAVEAALRGEPFEKQDGERSRKGTLGRKFRWYART